MNNQKKSSISDMDNTNSAGVDVITMDNKKTYKEKKRLADTVGKYMRKLAVFCCCICLVGQLAGAPVLTAQASGKKTETETEAKTEKSSKDSKTKTDDKKEQKVEIGKKTKASAYIKAKDWPKAPSIEAGAAVLMEAETGTVLYAKNPDTQLYPASITKIMTALLTLEDSKLTDKVVYEGEALRELPPNYTALTVTPGEKMTVEDCLNGLIIKSFNNVANALAVHDAGSIAAFAEKMNERAVQAGAKNTHFNNPSGEHEKNHYTTAYDMSMIMRECVQIDDFVKIAGSRVYTLQPTNKRKESLDIYALDKMLFPTSEHYYEYYVCGKTGYTDQARNTLVSYAEKDDMKLICVVMQCGKGVQYKDTEALFEYGFDNFRVADASETEERFTLKDAGILASENMESAASFNIEIPEGSLVVLPSGVSLNKIDTEIQYLTDAEDGCFAEVDYVYQDTVVGRARLKMSSTAADDSESFDFDSHAETESVESTAQNGSDKEDTLSDIWSRTKNIDVRIIIGAAAAIVIVVILCIIRNVRKKDNRIHFNKKGRRRRK